MKGSEAEKHEYWKARGWTQCACDDPECGCWFDPQGEPQLGLPDLPVTNQPNPATTGVCPVCGGEGEVRNVIGWYLGPQWVKCGECNGTRKTHQARIDAAKEKGEV